MVGRMRQLIEPLVRKMQVWSTTQRKFSLGTHKLSRVKLGFFGSSAGQGCQVVSFRTKNPNSG
jgi:hypothetical protein